MNVNIDRNNAISVLVVTILILILAVVFFRPLYIESPSLVSKPQVSADVETSPQQLPVSEFVIPVNSLPTDKDIEESIKIQNQRKKALEAITAERESKASQIRAKAEINMREDEPQSPPIEKEAITTPPEEIVNKVKSHQYFVH